MDRIQRIADELEKDVYKDPMHGKIARDNFLYGVAQQKIEDKEAMQPIIEENVLKAIEKQKTIDIEKACKEFCCSCMRENGRSCICLDSSKCRLYKVFRKAMEE